MSAEYDRLSGVCRVAKQAYDEAERILAAARFTLNYAERQRGAEWNKMSLLPPAHSGPAEPIENKGPSQS